MKNIITKKTGIFVLFFAFLACMGIFVGGKMASDGIVDASNINMVTVIANVVSPTGQKIAFEKEEYGWENYSSNDSSKSDSNIYQLKKNMFKGNVYGSLPHAEVGYDTDFWVTSDGERIEETTRVASTGTTLYLTLHTQYHKFAINYVDCEGATNANPATYTLASSVTLNNVAKDGYTFLGWTDSQNLSPKKDGITIDFATYQGDVTETAHWQANQYKVNFDANGGSGEMFLLDATYDEPKTLTECSFLNAGKNFLGWSRTASATDAEFCDKATFKNLTSKNGAVVVLFAVWTTEDVYVVNFASNGDGVEGSMNNQPFAQTMQKPLTSLGFSRKGYTFSHWNTQPDDLGESFGNEQIVSNLTEKKELTLYAIWTEKSYTIIFNANGGDGEMQSQTLKYSDSAKLSKNQFSMQNFEFAGWSLTSNGTVKYSNEQIVSKLADGGQVTLFAVWADPAQKASLSTTAIVVIAIVCAVSMALVITTIAVKKHRE